MTFENITTLNASATSSNEGSEGKRNKKTQILSALLSASALGVFLEGCGGGDTAAGASTPNPNPTPPPASNKELNAFVATAAEGETFTGSSVTDWVSYAGSDAEGVTINIDLSALDGNNAATGSGGWAEGDKLIDINNLIGSLTQINILRGNTADNTLRGGNVVDTLSGNEGNDILEGGEGVDTLYGGAGNDALDGGADDDRLDGGNGDDTLNGGEGGDQLYGGDGGDTLNGGAGVDTLNGNAGADTYLFGKGDGTDTITDNGGKIVFLQGTGNDYAGATYEFVRGGGDAVTLTVKDGGDNTLNVLEFASDPLSTFTFSTRSGSTDTAITSLVVPPKLGSENNPFEATAAADSFTGSTGADWVSYADSTADVGVTINLGALVNGAATASGGWAAGDTLTGFNNLIGTDGVDEFTGNGNANTLRGGGGDDTLAGGAGADTYLFGSGDGTDTITDDGGTIVFLQGTGNDYAGATYEFVRSDAGSGDAVTLTVKNGNDNTLNVLKFASDPSSTFAFYTRSSGGADTAIDTSSLVVPQKLGSENNPFLPTAAADSFTGSTGADWVSYADSDAGVTITLGEDGIASAEGVGGFAAGDTFTGINNLIGSAGVDELTGNANANTLRGGTGNDTLEGGVGADRLDGGGGNDDWASYSNSALGVRVNLLSTVAQPDFNGAAGFTANGNEAKGDILTNIENILGSSKGDWLTGNERANELVGGTGNDRLDGGTGNDTLSGGAGADTLIGGAGTDTLEGGVGADTLIGGASEDTYLFNAYDSTDADRDTITDDGGKIVFLQGTGNDYAGATYTFTRSDEGRGDAVTLTVKDENDNTLNVLEFASDPSSTFTFSTRSGSADTEIPATSLVVPDKLIADSEGSEGNPFLATADTNPFTGSEYNDWVSYADSTADVGVTIDLGTLVGGVATGSGGWAAEDTFTGINNLIGTKEVDELTGNAEDNTLRGGKGDDILNGGAGADTLEGGEGADTLDGGDFDNWASYSNSAKGVRVSLAYGVVEQVDFDGAAANQNEAVGDRLTNISNIVGSDHDDWLTGGDGVNKLVGGAGDDRLDGSNHDDTLDGGAGNDTLNGGDDTDTLHGGDGADILNGDNGRDTLNGDAGNDTLNGGDGWDFLNGGEGNDTLDGSTGNDELNGDEGNDELNGGAGIDTYLFNNGDGTDTILAANDGVGNKLVFATSGTDYDASDFTFIRGTLDDNGDFAQASTAGNNDLRIVVKGDPNDDTVFDNTVFIKGYYATGDNNAYTIYHTSEEAGNAIGPAETTPPTT